MAKMIYNWGKLDENGYIRYATNPLGEICNPAESHLRAAGFKPIVKAAIPESVEGGHYEELEPTEAGDEIHIGWKFVEDEPVEPTAPAPRVFSKLKCYAALKQMGYWDAVKTYLEANDLWEAFLLAQNVAENHPQFASGFAAVKSALGLTEEQGEAFLASVVED